MNIQSSIEVTQPVDKVWEFFQDVPAVAACLPGAELTEELGPDQYAGNVAVRMGPVKMQFAGTAEVVERDEESKTIEIDAAGADDTGQDQVRLDMTVKLVPEGSGTRLEVDQELHVSGAAAQYGRGMIGDVTEVLMRDFADNVHTQLDARDRGVATDQLKGAQSAGGFAIALRAAWIALGRVAARFFLPYRPSRT